MTTLRPLGSNALAASLAGHTTTVNLIELALDTGTIRLATGQWTLPWNGFDWLAVGRVLEIGEIEETAEIRAPGVKIVVSSVDDSLREVAQDAQYAYPNRPLTIYTAFLGANNQILDTPDIAWRGRISTMRIIDKANKDGSARVEIIGRNRFGKRIRQSTERRLSDEQQRARYPNAGGAGVPDEGLKFLATIGERIFTFGRR